MTTTRHLIGLLLGTEEDWPRAFEEILRRLGPVAGPGGTRHVFDCERITIEPFGLRDRPRYELVIDRLAYWYYVPREWLKKIALMDGVYLLNSPFTFQSMEKHAAYCAMLRLGLKVPDTVLVPYKNPVDNARYAYTAAKYNQPFDLDAIAERIGYPLFMKPYDGGAWRGVSRIGNPAELHAAYDHSGEMLMHLQKAIDDYDVFARSLSIGAETMVMRFQPDQPMHLRYAVDHSFLSPEAGAEVVTIGRLVNAFFRWEFNSCETLVKDGEVYPIDYANACPDVALTSLHYYFPWAIKALVKWCVFALVTGRRPRLDLATEQYFEIADDPGASYGEKLDGLPGAGRQLLRDRALPGLLRDQPGPRWTRSSWTGWRAPASTDCSSTRCGRCTRRTSTTSSSRTCAACSACGCATRAAGSQRPEEAHMGRDIQAIKISGEDRRNYRDEAGPLAGRVRRGCCGSACSRPTRRLVGQEIELNLVDADGEPSMRNADVLARSPTRPGPPRSGSSTWRSTCRRASWTATRWPSLEQEIRASLNHGDEQAREHRQPPGHDRHPADAAQVRRARGHACPPTSATGC